MKPNSLPPNTTLLFVQFFCGLTLPVSIPIQFCGHDEIPVTILGFVHRYEPDDVLSSLTDLGRRIHVPIDVLSGDKNPTTRIPDDYAFTNLPQRGLTSFTEEGLAKTELRNGQFDGRLSERIPVGCIPTLKGVDIEACREKMKLVNPAHAMSTTSSSKTRRDVVPDDPKGIVNPEQSMNSALMNGMTPPFFDKEHIWRVTTVSLENICRHLSKLSKCTSASEEVATSIFNFSTDMLSEYVDRKEDGYISTQ